LKLNEKCQQPQPHAYLRFSSLGVVMGGNTADAYLRDAKRERASAK